MTTGAIEREELFGHPKGLYILFFTELWERFSYYGMRAILVLFIMANAGEGPLSGLGWTEPDALALYGWYTMAVYVASIPGGLLADRLVGQKKAVMLGGLTLCAGHLVLAAPGTIAFYAGLVLIVLGVGMLKPNISTMVGGLYARADPRRDMGFNIFYMGINIGAFGSALIVGYVGEVVGWHYGFGLAGIGMLLGQAVYMWGQKHLEGIGDAPTKAGPSTGAPEAPLSKEERDRVVVLAVSFLIVIVFWGAFEQAGGLMNIFTKEGVDRGLMGALIPASWFQSLNPLFIIMFAAFVASFWIIWGKKGRESSSLFKMGLGTAIMGLGFVFMAVATLQREDAGSAWMWWIVLAYLFHTIGELCASPVALSFITKLAPVKYASLMMGAYFAMTGLGNKVAGVLGEAAVGDAGELAVFIGITAFCVVFGLLIIVFLKPLKRLSHGAEVMDDGVRVETPLFAKIITVVCVVAVPVAPMFLPETCEELSARVSAKCEGLKEHDDDAVKASFEECTRVASAVVGGCDGDGERCKLALYALDRAEGAERDAQAKLKNDEEGEGKAATQVAPDGPVLRVFHAAAAVVNVPSLDFKSMRDLVDREMQQRVKALSAAMKSTDPPVEPETPAAEPAAADAGADGS